MTNASLSSGEGWLLMDWLLVFVPLLAAVGEFALFRSPLFVESATRSSFRLIGAVALLALGGRAGYVMMTAGDWPLSPYGGLPVLGIAFSRLGITLDIVTRTQYGRRESDGRGLGY